MDYNKQEQIRIYLDKENIKYIKDNTSSISKFINEIITKERLNKDN